MRKLKRITGIVLVMLLLLNTFTIVSANTNDIKVVLDGQQIVFDVQPQIIDGRTMVPMRKIFESLGAVVSWDESSKTASGKMGDIVVNVTIDSNVLFKNGVPKTLDVAPALIDGRTLVPARAIAESFDCVVEWIAETRTVKITKNESFTQVKTTLTASEISDKVAPSVFYIEVYDEKLNLLGSGSGFFISSEGVAVTNYHVIEDTSVALIRTIDGDIFGVTNVIAYDAELDVAIIKIGKTELEGKIVDGFPCVTMADSDKIKAGQTVYAIGSPDGLENTISDGIISNVNRKLGDNSFIQTTAPIYYGSSGGALVNEFGEVIGITSSGRPEAENVGFAIPINIIKLFDVNADGMSYAEFAAGNNTFILDIYPEVVEVEVGKSTEILVYAEGKGDEWSIYWDTEEEYLIDCEWGEWSKEYDGIIPLTITGLREGVATVTIYSDVDFKGKDITVYIKKPAIETYPGTDIPTYTAVTGVRLTDYKQMQNSDLYIYYFYDTQTPQKYLDYLNNNGFVYDGNETGDVGTQFFYISPNGEFFSFVAAFKYNEIWIYVPKYR
ncbi:MAG: trypsin-like peptidase domain-containing protein [Clostridia bacterium]|nr:trypsin-like peptidase domain-containing protein [Clostridia bacterium]